MDEIVPALTESATCSRSGQWSWISCQSMVSLNRLSMCRYLASLLGRKNFRSFQLRMRGSAVHPCDVKFVGGVLPHLKVVAGIELNPDVEFTFDGIRGKAGNGGALPSPR